MLAGLKISLNLRVSFGCLKDSLASLSATVMDIINPMLSNPVMLNSFSKPANKSLKRQPSEMRNGRCHGVQRQVGIPILHKCQIKTERSQEKSEGALKSKTHFLVHQRLYMLCACAFILMFFFCMWSPHIICM